VSASGHEERFPPTRLSAVWVQKGGDRRNAPQRARCAVTGHSVETLLLPLDPRAAVSRRALRDAGVLVDFFGRPDLIGSRLQRNASENLAEWLKRLPAHPTGREERGG
jgi:hypothetical protein